MPNMPEPKDSGIQTVFPFKKLLETSSIIYHQHQLEDGFPVTYLSSNVSEVLGYEKEEFSPDKSLWFDKIHKNDRDRVLSSYKKLDHGGHATIEFRFLHKEGYYIWLRDEIKHVPNLPPGSSSVIGSSVEITEKKKAEAELRELNQTLEKRTEERTSKLSTANRKLKKQIQYRNKAEIQLKEQHEKLKLQQLAIDNLNDMVVVTKAFRDNPLNSKIIFVNKSFEEFTGYQSEEVVGRTPTFLHGPETSEEILARTNEKIANHETLREELVNYKKDGSPYWVELDMAPFPADDEDYEYWVGINRDITQRKQAEQKLEESERRYRAFAELSFDAIFEIDRYGTILNCNKRASELFGYNHEELIGMDTRTLMPEKYRDNIPDILTDTKTTGDEAWERIYKKKDGTHFPTEVHTQLFEVGGEERLISYVRDNTAHKEYENTIRKSLKEKETLLAEVHHRVKNNLAIISGLLEMQVFNTEDQQLLDKLKESQSRIQSIAMVHEKLYSSDSFSEIAIDKYINDLLEMIVGSMRDLKKDISIEKNMDPITLTVGKAIPCGLLLNELITNCYKHAFVDREEGKISISLKKDADQIVMNVSDNGCGLPDDFDAETQSSLGMTLINTLTKQLDGQLEVLSEHGSCFQISFKINNQR